MQVTEGHRLYARAPLTKVTWPTPMPETGKVQFSVEVDRDANATYTGYGTELRCRYWISGSLTDYRRYFVTTAPVFEIKNATPLTPTEWMTTHVLPLRELVALATLQPQTLTWATLDQEHEGATTEGGAQSFQLYSRDIQQTPYSPAAPPYEESQTLFTFPDLPYSPMELLQRWENLRTAHRGFIQPLMQGLTEQMNPRPVSWSRPLRACIPRQQGRGQFLRNSTKPNGQRFRRRSKTPDSTRGGPPAGSTVTADSASPNGSRTCVTACAQRSSPSPNPIWCLEISPTSATSSPTAPGTTPGRNYSRPCGSCQQSVLPTSCACSTYHAIACNRSSVKGDQQ